MEEIHGSSMYGERIAEVLSSDEIHGNSMSGNSGNSMSGKRNADEEVPEISSSLRQKRFPLPPRVPLSYSATTLVTEEDISLCVETALSFLNKKRKLKKGPYELVEALGCLGVRAPSIYHCNFTARQKNASEAQTKLFFAELMYTFSKEGQHILTCTFCCIVGSSGTKTGVCGCEVCEEDPDLVQHPKRRGYRKKQGFF